MKKLFTLVCAALFGMNLMADVTLVEFAANAEDRIGQFALGSSKVSFSTVKIHTNNDNVAAVKFESSIKFTETDKHYLVVKPAEGTFEEGDVVNLALCFSNSSDEKNARITIYSADTTRLFISPDGINGRTSAADPTLLTYTLEANQDSLFFGRDSANTTTFVTTLKIVRPAEVTEPVQSVTITGPTECYVGDNITLTATPDIKADTIWWTDKYGQVQESNEGVFVFTPDAAGEFEFTAWAENSHNSSPATKAQTITVKPAPCAKLYPAASGDDLSVGSVVALKEASVGGSIKVIGMKEDKSSIKYNAAGLQLGGGSADSILVILDNYLKEGSVIELTMQSGGKNGTRGLNILANNAKVFEATWAVADASDVQTIAYTVKAEDALVGLNQFGLQRNNSVYLKSVLVSNCGDEVPETPTALDNTDAAVKATKVVRNGQLLIEKNGETYNILGTRVR